MSAAVGLSFACSVSTASFAAEIAVFAASAASFAAFNNFVVSTAKALFTLIISSFPAISFTFTSKSASCAISIVYTPSSPTVTSPKLFPFLSTTLTILPTSAVPL